MADNNYDPKEVGGRQPIYCPYCNQEIKHLDSYHLSTANKRYHYPECWHKHELFGDPTDSPTPKAEAEPEPVPPPEEVLDESEQMDESPYRSGAKSKKK